MILTYGLNEDIFQKLENIAENYDQRLKAVSPEEALYTAGHLAGVEDADHRKFRKEPYPEDIEFLLFCGLSREALYNFLQDAAEEGLRFPHKAVLTDTTKNWPFSYLLGHIAEEHQVVTAYNQLGRKLKPYLEKENPALQDLIQEVKNLPKQDEDLTLEKIRALDRRLDQILKDLSAE